MGNPTNLPGDLVVPGDARIAGSISPPLARSNVLAVAENQTFTIPMNIWREHDDYATVLDGTAVANNHLAVVGGTHATNAPSLQTADFGGDGLQTWYARGEIVLPWNYVAAQTVTIRVHGGMLTTIASVSCLVDLIVCKSDKDSTASADICATAADSINSLVFADIDFTITPSSLSPGDVLDVAIAVATNDATNLGVMIACIGSVQLLCDVR